MAPVQETAADLKIPLRTIKEIQFGLYSPAEVKSQSVVRIEYPETMVSHMVSAVQCG